jgi:hypothetical protein
MKKSKTLSVLFPALVALSIMTAFAFSACGGDPEYTVKYEITGPECVADSVEYKNSTRNSDELTNVSIPWSHTIIVSGKYITLTCSAYFGLHNTNTYTARIYVNGKEVSSSSSSSSGVSVVYYNGKDLR